MCMSRGNSYDHKRKGHPGNFPENTIVEGKDKESLKQVADFATYEAFKNRVKDDEE
jgi:hypothetical protein